MFTSYEWLQHFQRVQFRSLVIALTLFAMANFGFAQTAPSVTDVVVVRRSNSKETLKRRGTITQWIGNSLTLATDNRDRQIENTDIVEIQTTWPSEYTAGLASIESGEMDAAIGHLQMAVANETRAWARPIIRADLVGVYLASEKYDAAIQQFLAIVSEDPQTRFFHLCPLQWFATNRVPQDNARKLVLSTNPVERLIGASWLLVGPDRDTATKALEQLSRDIDARIQQLAISQLWRLRVLNVGVVNARQIEVWEKQIATMPRNFRAGPLFVVAQAQSSSQQHDAAAINWLKIPILYPEQAGLSAAALYQAGLLLHNTGDAEGADAVRAELHQKFPQSVWASQR